MQKYPFIVNYDRGQFYKIFKNWFDSIRSSKSKVITKTDFRKRRNRKGQKQNEPGELVGRSPLTRRARAANGPRPTCFFLFPAAFFFSFSFSPLIGGPHLSDSSRRGQSGMNTSSLSGRCKPPKSVPIRAPFRKQKSPINTPPRAPPKP